MNSQLFFAGFLASGFFKFFFGLTVVRLVRLGWRIFRSRGVLRYEKDVVLHTALPAGFSENLLPRRATESWPMKLVPHYWFWLGGPVAYYEVQLSSWRRLLVPFSVIIFPRTMQRLVDHVLQAAEYASLTEIHRLGRFLLYQIPGSTDICTRSLPVLLHANYVQIGSPYGYDLTIKDLLRYEFDFGLNPGRPPVRAFHALRLYVP